MINDSKIPFPLSIVSGKSYFWCACGKSARQPLCDGSHRGSGIEPLPYRATADLTIALCGCKHTQNPPFCDGSHTHLK